jgi:para-aminobenzoate synthetase/4-amino-4-deoxychorismate lyase
VVLVESRPEREQERALWFRAPERVISCRSASDVRACLELAERARASGRFLAGFLAYEAGYGLLPTLAELDDRPRSAHALWLGVFESVEELRGAAVDDRLRERAGDAARVASAPAFNRDRAGYAADFERIQSSLHAGDSYQICHSLRARFHVEGSPWALFRTLRQRQRTEYSAVIDTGEYAVVSLSPELFFRKRGSSLELQPMKGTAAAGRDAAEDARIAQAMREDPKTRAENVMIVDLLRNDVGRLARPGSVRVPELFGVGRWGNVLQMTSRIVAEVDPELALERLLEALFPSGSVTGAPKLRTMQLIHGLEQSSRGIFCGSIGYVAPNNDACFNVAIRSLLIEPNGATELGVGSGVVVDSQSDAEFEECLLKASFVAEQARSET